MKKIFKIASSQVTVFTLFLVITSFQQAFAQSYLNLNFSDASNKYSLISDLKEITFSGTDVTFTKNDNSTITETISLINDLTFDATSGGGAPLPVEITSFTANYIDTNVVLNWETATEINNYGFEIERSFLNNDNLALEWSILGFVNGHGNSNSPKEYEFTDIMPLADSSVYRLKQIDTDGNYEYFSLLAKIGTINITDIEYENLPIKYELSQNYPNPFNPSTTINFQLPVKSYITLKVYDILGKEVAVLINEEKAAGKYSISFDGS